MFCHVKFAQWVICYTSLLLSDALGFWSWRCRARMELQLHLLISRYLIFFLALCCFLYCFFLFPFHLSSFVSNILNNELEVFILRKEQQHFLSSLMCKVHKCWSIVTKSVSSHTGLLQELQKARKEKEKAANAFSYACRFFLFELN